MPLYTPVEQANAVTRYPDSSALLHSRGKRETFACRRHLFTTTDWMQRRDPRCIAFSIFPAILYLIPLKKSKMGEPQISSANRNPKICGLK